MTSATNNAMTTDSSTTNTVIVGLRVHVDRESLGCATSEYVIRSALDIYPVDADRPRARSSDNCVEAMRRAIVGVRRADIGPRLIGNDRCDHRTVRVDVDIDRARGIRIDRPAHDAHVVALSLRRVERADGHRSDRDDTATDQYVRPWALVDRIDTDLMAAGAQGERYVVPSRAAIPVVQGGDIVASLVGASHECQCSVDVNVDVEGCRGVGIEGPAGDPNAAGHDVDDVERAHRRAADGERTTGQQRAVGGLRLVEPV